MCHLDQTKAAYLPRTGGYDFFPQMEEISPWLHGADATIGNLETPLAARSGEGAQAGTFPRFNAPHQLAANLREAGFTAVTLANNHILDQGMSGVARTIAELDEAGLAHAGAYDTQEAASGITLVQAGEGRVALLSYTQMDNGGQYRLSKQERAWALSWFSLDKAEADIAAAREQGADAVIVCVHWGSEYQRTPGRTDEKSAQALVDAGADAVIGHHPHVLQSAKLVQAKDGRSAVIAYSAGNFLSAQPYPYTQTGGLVHLSFQKDFVSGETRLTDAGFIVTYCERTRNEDGLRFFRVRPVDALLETPDSVSRSLRQKMLSAKEETAELFGPNGLPFLSR